MAARLRAIFLDKPDPDNNFTFNVALWADVPAGRQTFYANPDAKSRWAGATAPDLQSLQSGEVVERLATIQGQQGWTRAQLQAEAAARWQTFQTYITNFNPWVFYGTTLDPSGTWTNNGAP
jgi:hypothetical protein